MSNPSRCAVLMGSGRGVVVFSLTLGDRKVRVKTHPGVLLAETFYHEFVDQTHTDVTFEEFYTYLKGEKTPAAKRMSRDFAAYTSTSAGGWDNMYKAHVDSLDARNFKEIEK